MPQTTTKNIVTVETNPIQIERILDVKVSTENKISIFNRFEEFTDLWAKTKVHDYLSN